MKAFKLWALPALLAICGCNKEFTRPAPWPVPPEERTLKLISITVDGRTPPAESFDYDGDGRLVRRTEYVHNAMPAVFTYRNGKPVRAELISLQDGQVAYRYDLLYSGDLLDQINMIYTGADPQNATPMIVWKYSYVHGLLTLSTGYGPEGPAAGSTSRTVNSYYPDGNLKTSGIEERFGNDGFTLKAEVSYTYDDRVNPMQKHARYLAGFSAYLYAATHNILREIRREGPGRKITETIDRQYTYDPKGNPLSAVVFYHFPDDPEGDYSETIRFHYNIRP